jgi:hypothetical protein
MVLHLFSSLDFGTESTFLGLDEANIIKINIYGTLTALTFSCIFVFGLVNYTQISGFTIIWLIFIILFLTLFIAFSLVLPIKDNDYEQY